MNTSRTTSSVNLQNQKSINDALKISVQVAAEDSRGGDLQLNQAGSMKANTGENRRGKRKRIEAIPVGRAGHTSRR